jgi:hypothetical protein
MLRTACRSLRSPHWCVIYSRFELPVYLLNNRRSLLGTKCRVKQLHIELWDKNRFTDQFIAEMRHTLSMPAAPNTGLLWCPNLATLSQRQPVPNEPSWFSLTRLDSGHLNDEPGRKQRSRHFGEILVGLQLIRTARGDEAVDVPAPPPITPVLQSRYVDFLLLGCVLRWSLGCGLLMTTSIRRAFSTDVYACLCLFSRRCRNLCSIDFLPIMEPRVRIDVGGRLSRDEHIVRAEDPHAQGDVIESRSSTYPSGANPNILTRFRIKVDIVRALCGRWGVVVVVVVVGGGVHQCVTFHCVSPSVLNLHAASS